MVLIFGRVRLDWQTRLITNHGGITAMNFDFSRLRRCDQIIGVSAILLLIFMFIFKWWGYSSNAPSIAGVNVSSSLSFNGWHAFTNSRWLWLLTIIVALGAVAIAAGALKLESPVQLGVLVAGLGALSTIFIIYRIVHHPTASASIGSFHASVGIKLGIWLGLIAAAGITYGGYLAMQAEGTSLTDVRDQASGAISGLRDAGGSGATGPSRSAGGSSPASAPPTFPAAEAAAPPIPPPAESAPPSIPPPVPGSSPEQ
jgi:hypothetical protein